MASVSLVIHPAGIRKRKRFAERAELMISHVIVDQDPGKREKAPGVRSIGRPSEARDFELTEARKKRTRKPGPGMGAA